MQSSLNPRLLSALLLAVLPTLQAAPAPHGAEGLDAAASLAKLMEGNERFVAGRHISSKTLIEQRASAAITQHPFAVVIACADSRVAPEIVFDQGLGDLFVIRSAGNLVEDYALGSIEYAVEHLGTRLVLVLGHERCGAVGAALHGEHATGHLRTLVDAITPALALVQRTGPDAYIEAVAANARATAEKIRRSAPALAELAHAPVKIASATYDLDTGAVSLLE